MKEYGRLVGKVLGSLAHGVILGLSRDKGLRLEILRDADQMWHEIDRKLLYQILNRLKLARHIEFLKTRNGIENAKLTVKGRARFLQYQLNNLALPRSRKWDGRWRVVLFDIPEPKKKIRDSLRRKLKNIGFLEFQKSVFIYPYSCRDEINFIINFYNISENVYYLEAPLVPDMEFRRHFKI